LGLAIDQSLAVLPLLPRKVEVEEEALLVMLQEAVEEEAVVRKTALKMAEVEGWECSQL